MVGDVIGSRHLALYPPGSLRALRGTLRKKNLAYGQAEPRHVVTRVGETLAYRRCTHSSCTFCVFGGT